MPTRSRRNKLPSRVLRGIVLPALGFAGVLASTSPAAADPVDGGPSHASPAPRLPPPGTRVPAPGRRPSPTPPGTSVYIPPPSSSSPPPNGTTTRPVQMTPGPPPRRVPPPGPPVRHNRPGPPMHTDPHVGLEALKLTNDTQARSSEERAQTRRTARANGGDGEPGCAGAVAIRRRGPA